MITLDQVLLLQKKVETAVEKISTLNNTNSQLKAENDALRSKCAELTKALSAKTEQVSSLEDEQGKIEQGILNALNRLSTVENTVLNSTGSTSEPQEVTDTAEPQAPAEQEAPASEEIPSEQDAAQASEQQNTNTIQPEIF